MIAVRKNGAVFHSTGFRMRFKVAVAKTAFRALACLPLPLARSLGRLFGRGLYYVPNRSSRIVRINLAKCFPGWSEQQQQQQRRQRLQNLCATGMEMGAVWSRDGDKVIELVQAVEGLELVERAQAAGKGTIILAPHLGNWEVVGLYLMRCSDELKLMYAPPKNATMGQLILAARQRMGATLVPASRSGVVQLLKALRAGQMVGILPDQVPADESGVFAPFFGHPALSMTLMTNLARKTGASIVNAYALPHNSGFRIVFSEPDPEIYAADVGQSVAAMNRTVETCVRAHPTFYQWEYKRFKRQPENAAPFYD